MAKQQELFDSEPAPWELDENDDRLVAAMRLETIHFFGEILRTDTSIFQSVEDRDSMLAEGAVEGAIETVQRLAALLAKS